MKLIINNVYRTKSGETVVFLGYQDGVLAYTHGFFRTLGKPDTFFGLKLSEIIIPLPS